MSMISPINHTIISFKKRGRRRRTNIPSNLSKKGQPQLDLLFLDLTSNLKILLLVVNLLRDSIEWTCNEGIVMKNHNVCNPKSLRKDTLEFFAKKKDEDEEENDPKGSE